MRRANKFHLLLSGILFLSYPDANSQQIDPQINKDAPRLIPSTPNAAALTKYSGIDVALNTGMIKHEIPLYLFSAGKLSLPISLSYSSNGVRVDEFPSLAGMSWILNAGGVITRTVNGAIDETATRREVSNNWGTYSQEMLDYIIGYGNPYWGEGNDTEPDLYSFNFSGYSGKFVLNNALQPVIFPHTNLRVQTNFSGTTYNFLVTDPNGIKYYFGGSAATEESYSNNTAYANTQPHPIYIKTAYYLTRIEHPVNGIITFTYENYYHEMDPAGVVESNTHVTTSSGCVSAYCNCPTPCPAPGEKFVRSYVWYYSKILKEINAANWGKIVFNYSNYNLFNYSYTNNGALKLLYNFYVNDAKGNLIKRVNLNYNYYETFLYPNGYSNCPTQTKRPFLTSVTNGAETYSFEYYSPDLLPVISSYSQDHWGFYNGKNNGNNFISNLNNPVFYSSATADRNPDANYAYFGMLKKLTHPTGGINEVIYEGNTVPSGSTGGVRVKYLKTSDGVTSSIITKRIYYGPLSSLNTSSGYAVGPILDKDRSSGIICYYFFPAGQQWAELLTCHYTERSSNTANNLGHFNGSIIAYEFVTESVGGDDFEQGGIEHRFRISPNEYPTAIINGSVYDAPLTQGSTLHGVETKTKIFRKEGAQFITLRETTNNYSALPSNYYTEVNGWKVNIRWVAVQYPLTSGSFAGFDVIKTTYKSFWERLDNTVTVVFDQSGSNPLTTTKNYYYNNNTHLQVTRIETFDSEGDLLKTEFRYPSDFNGPVYTDLVSRNIITPVLDQQVFSNGFLKEQTQLNYKYAGLNNQLLVPDMVKHTIKYNSLENIIQYEQYDQYGNPIQFTSADGIRNSFIWDYNHQLPIAEVKNAMAVDIAYTSFEAEGKGNWNFSGLQFTDGSCPTGKRVYALVTGDISKSGLSAASKYIISYWSKNGPQSVNGSTDGTVTGISVNGWTYYERLTLCPANGTITISGSGIIDELRLYPEKALISTFTYSPLTGITSQCDANNRITYFEYDEHQRLIVIRDMDRNVSRKFCYNYAGSLENCNVFYNEAISLSFTRNDCPYGLAGGQVTYLIPAGTYVSTIDQTDANNKAWDDIIFNGQAYANALGSCGSSACSPVNCSGDDKKCVNDICETGIRVYTDFYEDQHTGNWICVYHYEWSDGSWSQDYYEISPVSCKR